MDPRKTLLALQPGETGLVALLEENDFISKLMALGILPNTRVKMVRKAPFGKVFYVKLDDHQIAIREAEANTVIIEEVI
ncbi:MAG: ferrous iron transport protein A [Chitinophagales bacterium]|nr:ferrous iron transport protein A [Chitinophagales bacterium]